jgi:hypothetical protein
MALWRIRIFKAYGGRSGNAAQWSNEYAITTDDELTSAAMLAAVTRCADFEKAIHLNNIHFMRAVVSTYGPDAIDNDPLSFRTIQLAGTGANDAAVSPTEFLDLTMRVTFAGETGRAASHYYRGCLTEAMVGAGNDGGPTITQGPFNFAEQAGALINQLGGAILVLPSSKAPTGLPTRLVKAVAVGGASIRKRHVRRKKKVAESSGAAGEMLATALEIAVSVLSFVLTKGKGLPVPQRALLSGASSVLGNTIGAITRELTDGQDGVIPGPL